MEVNVKKMPHFDSTFPLPSYQSLGAAGADIRAQLLSNDNDEEAGKEVKETKEISLLPGVRKLIPTGLCFEIPRGYELQVRPRSGLALKSGLMILNSPGTIDSDYRGELMIIVGNMGNKEEIIRHGDRIAQIVLAPVVRALFVENSELTQTERGDGGFGHTGTH